MADSEVSVQSSCVSFDISSDFSDFSAAEYLSETEEIFIDQSGVERPAIGVLPYQFEPEYDADDPEAEMQVEVEDDEESEDDARRLVDLNYWCSCGNCQIMETALECRCCQTMNVVQQKLTDPLIEGADFKCVTEHPGFEGACLNIWALEVAFLTFKAQQGNHAPDGPNHERYRYVAYRQFVRWCWGFLGKDPGRPTLMYSDCH
ncbi:uncharacterized protein LOC135493646 [Lineus longissimus]|uniref:uncharacterized protein LOC135493646 n=1 Tax=Lineus longissimus TaxID=88925 RepID=UPI00315CCB74